MTFVIVSNLYAMIVLRFNKEIYLMGKISLAFNAKGSYTSQKFIVSPSFINHNSQALLKIDFTEMFWSPSDIKRKTEA